MKRKAEETWRDVVVGKAARLDGASMGVLCVTGGMCRTHEGAAGFALECEERDVSVGGGGSLEAFVPVGKHRLWVLKVVGGHGAVKGALNETTLLEQLHAKLRAGEGDNVCDKGTPAKTAPAAAGAPAGASAAAGEEARDPMADLLGTVKGAPKAKKVAARGQPEKTPEKSKGCPRGTLCRVTVPMSPDPDEADTKQVVVYENKQGILFVQSQDLPWLLQYLYEEVQGKSVPEPKDDDDDALDEKRPWTTRWCPSGMWTVVVKGGPLAGKQWASKIQDLNDDKWSTGVALTEVTTPFKKSTRAEQKQVLLAFLEDMVQKAIAQETEK